MNSITIENLAKMYAQGSERTVKVFDHLSLDLSTGESASLMGRSGSGKSTLLSILAGLETPSSGTIKIGNTNLFNLTTDERSNFRAKNIGIIFQQFHLLPHLTAYENVRLPLDLGDDRQAHDRTLNVLEKVGLAERASHLPSELSRGENQRVAIARVLVTAPKIILADEPTASLDDQLAEEVSTLLFNVCEEFKITLVIATHDPEVASRCHKRFSLAHGKLSVL